MNFITLSYKQSSIKNFVNYWNQFYDNSQDSLYVDRINKRSLIKSDIEKLFEWKNGGKLSEMKKKSLSDITDKLIIINRLKENFSLEEFLKEFKFYKAPIWKIFLLHIICPKKYPIFDQHVCRAYYFIDQNHKKEIPLRNNDKERLYFDKYIPFFEHMIKYGFCSKKLDEALWAFGKFLKTGYGKQL